MHIFIRWKGVKRWIETALLPWRPLKISIFSHARTANSKGVLWAVPTFVLRLNLTKKSKEKADGSVRCLNQRRVFFLLKNRHRSMFSRWNSWQSQTKRQFFLFLYTFSLSFSSKEFFLVEKKVFTEKNVAFFLTQWFFHGNFSVTGPIIGIIHLNEKMMRFASWKWIFSFEIGNNSKQNHWFQTTMNIFSQRESDEKKKKMRRKRELSEFQITRKLAECSQSHDPEQER